MAGGSGGGQHTGGLPGGPDGGTGSGGPHIASGHRCVRGRGLYRAVCTTEYARLTVFVLFGGQGMLGEALRLCGGLLNVNSLWL